MIVPMRALEHSAPVEDIGVTDAEADREDEVTDQRSDQAEPEGKEPGHRTAHLPEGIAGNE